MIWNLVFYLFLKGAIIEKYTYMSFSNLGECNDSLRRTDIDELVKKANRKYDLAHLTCIPFEKGGK